VPHGPGRDLASLRPRVLRCRDALSLLAGLARLDRAGVGGRFDGDWHHEHASPDAVLQRALKTAQHRLEDDGVTDLAAPALVEEAMAIGAGVGAVEVVCLRLLRMRAATTG